MFYRRKILLALVEVFGGSLTKTDCQKLLFLFCWRRGKNYYDFFPHKYGSFSLVLSQDKSRLADLDFLCSRSEFQLKSQQSYLSQIDENDRRVLLNVVAEIGELRGEELIRKTYLEFPFYASRSTIATKILKREEYEIVSRNWMGVGVDTACIFTVGYEGLSIDAYLNILLLNNITTLVDVRKNPISMKFGFSKTRLAEYAKGVGISYFHIPSLGIPSNLRQELNSVSAYQKLFDHYSSEILPGQRKSIEDLKAIINTQKRVAITCFEADHHFCHRHKLTEYLENDICLDIPIIHLSNDCTKQANLNYNHTRSFSSSLWNETLLT